MYKLYKPRARYNPTLDIWSVFIAADVEGLDTPLAACVTSKSLKHAWDAVHTTLLLDCDLAEHLVAIDQAIQETFTPKWWRWLTGLFKK